MSFRNLFQQLGFWTTLLSWQEPSLYRVHLRRDMWPRLALAMAIGCVPLTLLLVLFAINNNPPHPGFALAGFAFGAALAGLVLFRGESTAGGAVRICQEGIIRKRQYTPLVPVHLGFEEANWPYDAFSRAILVPGQSIGQPFSVLLLTDERNIEIVGVPASISPHELAQTLAARGVRVEAGTYLPEMFTRPLAWPIAGVAGAIGLVLVVGGLGFYGIKTLGGHGGVGGGPVARAPDPKPAVNAPAFVERPNVQRDGGGANANRANPAVPPLAPAAPPPNRPANANPAPLPPLGGVTSGFPTIPSAPFNSGVPTDPFAPAPAAPGPVSEPAAPAAAGDLVGGKGGGVFKAISPSRQPIVGFRYAVGAWGGKQALAQLDPVFERGLSRGSGTLVMARDGYAVSGLQIDATDLVNAVQIVFARQQADGSLDPADSYTSDWLGAPTGAAGQKLASGTRPLIGIHGRRGAVIDALGLVLDER